MSNKEKATKISWLTLAFMAFSTVWGFGNITNGFVYFNGPQVIFSWIFMFVLYFIPYALMVGELGSAFKNEGGGVSSWLHQTTNAKLAYYAGWTYWACHITYIASKGSGFLKALSWAVFRNAETYDSFPTRYIQLATFCILLLGCSLAFLLHRMIAHPISALQSRIEKISGGDFSADPDIEWDNELGDIGRGINSMSAGVTALMEHRLEDEKQKQDLEYRMLQNEVNPHFIYNTLNSIRWMATIQHAPGIAEMVTAFARLTKSISKGTQKLVPLQEELALLNDYFTIQQYRYGGDLEIEVSRIESETLCRDCMIPRFTLQPLVENAIFHGLEPKGGHGSVLLDISTDSDTGDVLLRITDDGVGMPPEQVAHLLDEPAEGAEKAEKFRHVGLWNVNRRIRYSFGEGYGLTIESEEDVGTEVTIRLPYQQKGDSHAADITGG
jgi:two-component system sensor histidine kinase YesM